MALNISERQYRLDAVRIGPMQKKVALNKEVMVALNKKVALNKEVIFSVIIRRNEMSMISKMSQFQVKREYFQKGRKAWHLILYL